MSAAARARPGSAASRSGVTRSCSAARSPDQQAFEPQAPDPEVTPDTALRPRRGPAGRPPSGLAAGRHRTTKAGPRRDCASCSPPDEVERDLDDWGRSERMVSLADPLLNFYYRYWFRVEAEGIENVPGRRRRAARLQPLRRAAARRADDHAGDPQRAPRRARRSTCSASTGSRATPASACSPTRSASSPPTRPTRSGCSTTRAGSRSSSPRA